MSEQQRDKAYDQIDRYLRNNLSDEDYADYSQALDLIYTSRAAAVQDMPALIERIETRVGMGCGAWDMVNAADLVRAVIAEATGEQQ